MATIPHIAYPVKVVNGRLATVEQDSPEDVSKCLLALLSTEIGEREELPEYGILDPSFQGFDEADVRAVVAEWEPRAEEVAIDIEADFDTLTELVRVG
jgi:phage baseplate assembly protein W